MLCRAAVDADDRRSACRAWQHAVGDTAGLPTGQVSATAGQGRLGASAKPQQ